MNLLDDPMLHVRKPTGGVPCTLPGVLEYLARGEVEAFTGLQSWQEHAWFAFLVQLAALSMQRADHAALPTTEGDWHARLLALANGQLEPWTLVVTDLSEPAFLQPPIPRAELLKRTELTPDAIDLPVTSKNHDLKAARLRHPAPEHWVYALVSLQTTQGFSGRGNYGIARMNGGFGNRPYAACVHDLSWGARFRADVMRLLRERDAVVASHGFAAVDGQALLWLSPWNGTDAIPLASCDPWCIEICRLIRLVDGAETTLAKMGATKAARLSGTSETGDVGDPWTPVEAGSSKALTLGGSGWRYDLLVDLLIDRTYRPSLAMDLGASEAQAFVGRALVRGQGTTEGFHERLVPIPSNIASFLSAPEPDARLSELAGARVKQVAEAQNVLASAIRKLLAAGGDSTSSERRHVPWLEAFRNSVDAVFFPQLWQAVEDEDAEAESLAWIRELHRLAGAQLEDAIRTAPLPQARRLRAVAAAESVFHGGFRKRFPTFLTEGRHVRA